MCSAQPIKVLCDACSERDDQHNGASAEIFSSHFSRRNFSTPGSNRIAFRGRCNQSGGQFAAAARPPRHWANYATSLARRTQANSRRRFCHMACHDSISRLRILFSLPGRKLIDCVTHRERRRRRCKSEFGYIIAKLLRALKSGFLSPRAPCAAFLCIN